mmetsp:Transcript_28034/g.58445  ORF Transcript_28034/g.58445 Transcript_28034/m.58445 type:complete len:295 (-) Transcript_28034:1275-2159(-)
MLLKKEESTLHVRFSRTIMTGMRIHVGQASLFVRQEYSSGCYGLTSKEGGVMKTLPRFARGRRRCRCWRCTVRTSSGKAFVRGRHLLRSIQNMISKNEYPTFLPGMYRISILIENDPRSIRGIGHDAQCVPRRILWIGNVEHRVRIQDLPGNFRQVRQRTPRRIALGIQPVEKHAMGMSRRLPVFVVHAQILSVSVVFVRNLQPRLAVQLRVISACHAPFGDLRWIGANASIDEIPSSSSQIRGGRLLLTSEFPVDVAGWCMMDGFFQFVWQWIGRCGCTSSREDNNSCFHSGS